MAKYFTYLLILVSIILLFSCSAGTWEDDKNNWQRAFNVEPSKGISIKHSWYWRSPHFTMEQEYFFELEYSDSLEKEFLKAGDLVKVNSTEYQNINFFHHKPQWFVPRDFKFYDIYKSTQYEHYYLFIDRRNKNIFFTEFQV